MFVAAAVGQLDDTQPVARRNQSHRLGIDGNRGAGGKHVAGQVFFMEMDGHGLRLAACAPRLNGTAAHFTPLAAASRAIPAPWPEA